MIPSKLRYGFNALIRFDTMLLPLISAYFNTEYVYVYENCPERPLRDGSPLVTASSTPSVFWVPELNAPDRPPGNETLTD